MKIYSIHTLANGSELCTMACPKGGDSLNKSIEVLSLRGIKHLICLLETKEIEALNIEQEEALCRHFEINYWHYPIPDFSLPLNKEGLDKLILRLKEKAVSGDSIVIHCRAGIGRSSMLAAALLVQLGFSSLEAIEKIRTARACEVPDTEAQKNWILALDGY